MLAAVRRLHGWLGLWGGVMGLLFGLTGIVQNHRAILPIAAKKVERSVIQLPLAETPPNAETLGRALQAQLGFTGRPMRSTVESATSVEWNGQSVEQPERWQFWFEAPQRYARAEYYVANRFVKVERFDANLIASVARLHQAIGVDAGWVLVADTIAGSIILLALSGMLLWSRLEPRRLLGLGAGLLPLAFAAGSAIL